MMATVTFIKYERQSAGTLGGVTGYVLQKGKTMQVDVQQLVSGQNCNPQLAFQEFLATRTVYRKDSPVYFYHYVQSFHPDEPITGKTAHEVAKEFAARAWPDSEVLLATHIDAEHIHTHFIVNAVCFETGKMLRQGPQTLATLRPISDEICLSHHLSVLPKQQKKADGMSAREYRSAAKGESWKLRLINTIDDCMRYAASREEFISLMKSEGYGVRWESSRANITYTIPSGYKCRDDRLHDERYLKGAMEREFRIREKIIHGGIETAESAAFFTTRAEYAEGSTGVNDTGSDRDHSAIDGDARAGSCGSASDAGGVVGAADGPCLTGSPHGGAGSPCAGAVPAGEYTSNARADRGAGAGCGGDTEPARTGWEKERAALFTSPSQTTTSAPSAPILGAATYSGNSAGALGSVVQLGHALERNQDAAPVMDATTKPTHHERDKKRKLAPGQKADDHEAEQDWQHTMY